MDELFIGSALCEVTSGGEILLPRSFHETVRGRSPDGRLYIGLHEESPCLVAFDSIFATQQQWDFETRKTSFIGSNLDAHHARLRRAFGCVEQAMLAPDGMVTLGPLMRRRGQIGNTALLVATGQRFEIWDLDYVLERAPAELVTLATLHLQVANEECHGPSLQSVDPLRRTARNAQSGLRLQHLSAMRPRHDPVGGVSND